MKCSVGLEAKHNQKRNHSTPVGAKKNKLFKKAGGAMYYSSRTNLANNWFRQLQFSFFFRCQAVAFAALGTHSK